MVPNDFGELFDAHPRHHPGLLQRCGRREELQPSRPRRSGSCTIGGCRRRAPPRPCATRTSWPPGATPSPQARTPAGAGPPTVGPSRSARPATAASPRQTACPPTGSTSAPRCRRSPTARRPQADPSTLNIAWNGTRAAHQHQRRDRAAALVGPDARRADRRARRDDHVDVVVDRLDTFGDFAFRALMRIHPPVRDQPTDPGEVSGAGLQSLGPRQRLHVVVGPAEVPGQRMDYRGRRIVRIPLDHLMPQFAQQRCRLLDRGPLLGAHARHHSQRGPSCSTQSAAARALSPRRRRNPDSSLVTSRNSAASSTVRAIGPLTTQAVPGVVVWRHRHSVPLRLDPEQPAPRRRNPDRPHAVGPQRHRCESRGHRRAAATAAATRRVVGVPRIARRTERERLGERPQHHLGHGGLADDDRACLAEPPHHLGVGGASGSVGRRSRTSSPPPPRRRRP